MQFKRFLLICSALITSVCCFPTATEVNVTTSLPQNETTVLDTKENRKPLVIIMEEKTPKSDSVVVQFVYSSNGGNSIIESKGSDKDKYTVEHPKLKEKPEGKLVTDKGKEKPLKTLKVNKVTDSKNEAPKPNSIKNVQMMETSLVPEEISPLTGKWPKYLNDALNPIPPFPELHFRKPSQINSARVQNENADSSLTFSAKEKKEVQNVAGPQLSPLSIYDREFNVPIFD